MKESKKVSISGVAFVFDIDAHEVLENYLNNLNETYKDTADGEEIVADIEARIAELILSRQDNRTVVSLPLVRSIIDQMGSPEAIEEESNEGEPKPKEREPRIPRRLYRNPEGSKLGGVCSGIGTFFDIDPVWVRLAMFAPIAGIILFETFNWYALRDFCGSTFGLVILGYIVMWFAIPKAKSARQKLEMTGEKINAQTISSRTHAESENADYSSADRSQSVIADIVYVIGRIMLFCLKAFALLMLAVILASVIACIVGLFALMFVAPDNEYELFSSFATHLNSPAIIALSASAIVCVLLPLVLLVYLLSGFVFGHKINRTFSYIVGGAWIVALVVFFATAFSNHEQIRKGIKEAEMRETVERNLRRWNVNDNFLDAIDLNDVTVKVYNHTYNVDPEGENVIEIGHDQLYISIPERNLKVEINNGEKEPTTLEESADEVVKAAGAMIESAGRAIVSGSEAEIEEASKELVKAVIDVTKVGLDSAAVALDEIAKTVNEPNDEVIKAAE